MEVTGMVSRVIRAKAGDQSEVGNARRQALSLGSALDFTEVRCAELGIVVTEAARNLAAHGGGGELLLTPWKFQDAAGVDVLALDTGVGIRDMAKVLEDGYSTGGTPGTGLGAIARLADSFELFSQPEKGTALFARLLRAEKARAPQPPRWGSLGVPFGGETVSGDAWGVSLAEGRAVYAMADGLGHGSLAEEAAREAMRAFHSNAHLPPTQILLAIHAALQKTRGAAIGIAEVPNEGNQLIYTGSGNITASVYCAGHMRSMVSMNGTPGHNIGPLQEFTYPLREGSTLLMHSDGLQPRWNLAAYPSLAARHPGLIAGVLYRDFSRRRDDSTVLVARL